MQKGGHVLKMRLVRGIWHHGGVRLGFNNFRMNACLASSPRDIRIAFLKRLENKETTSMVHLLFYVERRFGILPS